MPNEQTVRSLLREQSGKQDLSQRQEAILQAGVAALDWDGVEEAILDAVNQSPANARVPGGGSRSLSHLLANVQREAQAEKRRHRL